MTSPPLSSSKPPAPLPWVPLSKIGVVAAVWGLGGIVALLGEALARLVPRAMHLVDHEFDDVTRISLAGILIFFAAIEGYGGFQRSFAPRAAARAGLLMREGLNAGSLRLVLAPLFCMALIGARQKRLIVNWCLLVGIVVSIVLVMRLPEPWRAMIDAGVVVGLTWGMLATLWFAVRVLTGHDVNADLELPENDIAHVTATTVS